MMDVVAVAEIAEGQIAGSGFSNPEWVAARIFLLDLASCEDPARAVASSLGGGAHLDVQDILGPSSDLPQSRPLCILMVWDSDVFRSSLLLWPVPVASYLAS